MITFFLIFFTSFGFALSSEKHDMEIKNLIFFFDQQKKPISRESIKLIEQGEVITKSEVLDFEEKKIQSLNFYIIALHPRPCAEALKKLSHYENYKNLIDFIKMSNYDDKNNQVFFTLDSKLLPTAMNLSFRIPRIERPGIYPFSFDNGIFTGLNGSIRAYDYHDKKKCLLYTDAYWKGTHTKYPNVVVELFSETLSKMAMEKMIRVTKL